MPSLLKSPRTWRNALLAGGVLILLWYGAADPRGRLMAYVDHSQGRYRLKGFFPDAAAQQAYKRLLEEKYGVTFDVLEFASYSGNVEAYAYGYNEVSVRLLNEKYGRDIFAECRKLTEVDE